MCHNRMSFGTFFTPAKQAVCVEPHNNITSITLHCRTLVSPSKLGTSQNLDSDWFSFTNLKNMIVMQQERCCTHYILGKANLLIFIFCIVIREILLEEVNSKAWKTKLSLEGITDRFQCSFSAAH